MTQITKTKTVIIVPCVKCSTLNRVEMEYGIEPAKSIGEEVERQKLEEAANHDKQTNVKRPEGERVRPDDSKGKPVEGSTDDSTSDKPRPGTDSKSKGEKTK